MIDLITILVYALYAYGLTNMLVYGYGPYDIIDRFRNIVGELSEGLGKMFDCMMCTGANVGWISSVLNILLIPDTPLTFGNIVCHEYPLVSVIIDLCATSGLTWALDKMVGSQEGAE